MAGRIRVLHIGEGMDATGATAEALEAENDRFEVTTISDGGEDRDRLAEGEFDCVILECPTPGESACIETVRADGGGLPHLRFTAGGETADETNTTDSRKHSEQYDALADRITTAVDGRPDDDIERENDRFANAQDIANVGHGEYDVATGKSHVSEEMLRLHGLGPDEDLSPESSIEHYHPEDRDRIREAFRQAVEDGVPYDLESRLIDEDGRQRWVRARGRPHTEDGETVRVQDTLQDITEQKQRERTLERQNERLEEFANVISHDIRNPLQVASGHLEVARQTGDDASFRKAHDALDRIDTIIENVLTLARHGQSIDGTSAIELPEVAADAWKSVDTKHLTLEIGGDCEVDANAERLQQLLENLFRNAAEQGESLSTITIGPIEPMFTSTRADADTVRGFFVADDGPGIPADDQADVFDSGFTTGSESTGLGLSIVAQIAEAHGWQPTVTDSRGGGARFEFTDAGAV